MRLFDGSHFNIQKLPRVHGKEIFEAGADEALGLFLCIGDLN